MPIETELAWCAGFFDGEGTTCTILPKDRPNRPYRIGLTVPQVDRRALDRFHNAVGGLGRVCCRNQRTEHSQQCFVWQAQKRIDVETILTLLWPYLGEAKKEQATKALALFYTNPSSYHIGRPFKERIQNEA